MLSVPLRSVLRAEDATGSEPVPFTHDSKVPLEHLQARALRGSGTRLAAWNLCRGCSGLIWRGGWPVNQPWKQGGPVWSRCAACGDLRGPTAWTSRGYFWRGFVRLDTAANPDRKEEGSLTHCLRPDSHPRYRPHPLVTCFFLLGKRQVIELRLKDTLSECLSCFWLPSGPLFNHLRFHYR